MTIPVRSLVVTLMVALAGCAPQAPPDAGSASPPDAQQAAASERQASKKPESKKQLGALAKVSSHLLEARRRALAGESAETVQQALPLVQWTNGMARVEVRLARLTPEVLGELRGAGLADESHSFEYAAAYGGIRLEALEALASVDEVSTIRPMPRARTRGD